MAVRQIGSEIVLRGEKEFNAAMTSVNNNLKTMRTDMAAVSAEFSENADSVEALTAKQKILQDSVDQQKVKVNALRQMHERVISVYGESSAQADKYKQQLNAATVALAKESTALEKNKNALKQALTQSQKYTPITQKMANAVKQTGSRVKEFTEKASESAHNLPVLSEALDMAKVSAKGLGAATKGAKTVVGGLGSAAGTAAKGIGKIAAGAAKAAAAIAAAAATIGIAGVTAMVNFAKESADAAKAAYEAGETLTDSQQKWLEYSNQLGALEESTASAKSALGSVLLPVLSELSTEGASFLNDFSADMEAAAGDAGKQAEIMGKYIAEGARRIIENLPEYIQVAKDLVSGLGQGLSESGPELLDMGLDLVIDLLNGIIEFAPELANAAIALIEKLIEFLGDHGPELVTSAVNMVTQIVSGLAKAAPDLVPAAYQLISQLLIALIHAAPDLIIAGVELIYGLISGLFTALGNLIDSVDDIIEAVVVAFGSKAEEFKALGKKIIQGIKDGLMKAWEAFSSWFNNLWDSLFGDREVNVDVNGTQTGEKPVDGSHAGGLDYVPFDGYLARLHRGEQVLTSFEAALYRQGKIPGGNNPGKTVTMNFYAQSITQSDIEMICDVVNRKLGEAM